MRYGVGLLSLLLGVAVILWLFAGLPDNGGQTYLGAVAQQRKQALVQANTWAGKAADGSERATDSLTFEMLEKSGSIDAIVVKTVRSGGSMHVRYGLAPGDQIIEIGPLPVRGGALIADVSSARDFLHDAYARKLPLKIRRGDQELTLPTKDFIPPAYIPPNPATQPAESSDDSADADPRQTPGILGRLRGIPTH